VERHNEEFDIVTPDDGYYMRDAIIEYTRDTLIIINEVMARCRYERVATTSLLSFIERLRERRVTWHAKITLPRY